MFLLDPDFYPSRITDPTYNNFNRRGGCKIEIIIYFYRHRKILRSTYFLSKKWSISSQKYELGIRIRDSGSEDRDPRTEIREKPIPDPGVEKAQDPGSGSVTLGKISIKKNDVCRSGLRRLRVGALDHPPAPYPPEPTEQAPVPGD
jgi:hypothetical protein